MTDKLLAEYFWVNRWMASSAFMLSLEARGLYREMLSQAWIRGARLPNDPEQIRRLTAVTVKEWKRAWPVVSRYWRQDGTDLVNDTQLDIYAKSKTAAEKASQHGRNGGRASAQARARGPTRVEPGFNPSSYPSSNASGNPSSNASSSSGSGSSVQKDPSDLSVLQEREITKQSLSLRAHARDAERAREVPSDEIGERAGRLLQQYQELYVKHRNGARCRLLGNSLEYQDACAIVREWPDDNRLQTLMVMVLTTDDEFISKTDRSFRIFAMKATWADDRLKQWEIEHKRAPAVR